MAPSNSTPFTDPFSAVYKTRPGQLPSFFSIENYQTKKKHNGGDDENPTQNHQSNTSPQAPATKEKANQSTLDPPNVFSPLLAGERDRLVRKRILSNPVHLSTPCSIDSSTSTTKPSSSLSTRNENDKLLAGSVTPSEDDDDHLSWASLESSDENDDEKEKITLSEIHLQLFSTKSTSDHQIERSSIPVRSSIFFSPPKDLPSPARIKQTKRGRSHLEKDLDLIDRDIFSSFFTHAIRSGNAIIDLDNRQIEKIPNLSGLLSDHKDRLAHYYDKEAEKMTTLIEKMVNPTSPSGNSHHRQAMTRVRSAPSVSFAPHTIFTLILSHNYLNSNFSKLQRISDLRGLQVLSLQGNFLTEVPREFGELTNLKELNLSNNLLNFLPSSVLKLRNCRFLLNGNPLFQCSSLDEKFRWISKPKKVFYRDQPNSFRASQRSMPSLMEYCIRRLSVTRDPSTGEESVMEVTSRSTDMTVRLPGPIRKMLLKPSKSFTRCELCQNKLILNSNLDLLMDASCKEKIFDQDHHHINEFFQFVDLHLHDEILPTPNLRDHQVLDTDLLQNLVPIRWIACSFNCCIQNLINT